MPLGFEVVGDKLDDIRHHNENLQLSLFAASLGLQIIMAPPGRLLSGVSINDRTVIIAGLLF